MYNHDKWRKRLRNRNDMSTYLTHLTKEYNGGHDGFPMTDVERLLKILRDRKLLGSKTGYINSGTPVVCFQESPIYDIAQNVEYEMLNKEELGGKNRYAPVGLTLSKKFVFSKGGRPVIYERPEIINDNKCFPAIKDDALWRVVSLDLTENDFFIDWTHEREWRVKGDVDFTLDEVSVILADRYKYREFISKVDEAIVKQINGIVVLENIVY